MLSTPSLITTSLPRSSSYPRLMMLERSFGMSYTSVSAMLAIPAPEDDGATASDHHPRAIAELDRAGDAALELGERPLEPVMWLLAQLTIHLAKADLSPWLVEVDNC